MNLGRVFAHAVVRKVAAVLVVALLAWAGIGRAEAACAGSSCATKQEAYAKVLWTGSDFCPVYGQPNAAESATYVESDLTATSGRVTAYYKCNGSTVATAAATWSSVCPAGSTWDPVTYKCSEPCSQRPDSVRGGMVVSTAMQCVNGCEVLWQADPADDALRIGTHIGNACNADNWECPLAGWQFGTGVHGSGESQICTPPPDPNCPNGVCDEKPDECPVGQHADSGGKCVTDDNVCPAGSTKGPDGKCMDNGTCPAGKVKGPDGTCKNDADGDGEPDGDDPNAKSFSGGESCDTPPACSGDAIMCGQARIQWRIDCNTRKNVNISGGACAAPPVCVGEKCSAMEYSQLLMQWRTACATEKALSKVAGEGASSVDYWKGERGAEKAALEGIASGPDGTEGTSPADAFHEFSGAGFNPNLFGGSSSGTCSFTTTLQLMGEPIDLGPDFWMLAGMIGWLIVAAAYVWVAMMLGS